MSLWSRVQRRLGDLAGELVLDEHRVQLDRANVLLTEGRVPEAIAVLEALLLSKPDHGQALMVLGEAQLGAQAPQRALEAFERALKLRAGDPAALLGHGLALVDLARYEPAIASLGRAVSDAAGDRAILAEAYRGLGIAWRRRGDLDKAIRELRKAVAENSDDVEARAALGEALVTDGGPYDEALRHLERATTVAPGPALALYALGRLALLAEQTDARPERGVRPDTGPRFALPRQPRATPLSGTAPASAAAAAASPGAPTATDGAQGSIAPGAPGSATTANGAGAAAAPAQAPGAATGPARGGSTEPNRPSTEVADASARARLATARRVAEANPTPLGQQVRFDIIVAQGEAALAARDALTAHAFFLEALQFEPRRAQLHAQIAATHRSIGNLDAAIASYERALALGAGHATLRDAVDAAIAAEDTLRQARWASDLLALDPTDLRAIVARGAAIATTQPEAARSLFVLAAARDDVDAHVWLARLALPGDPTGAAASAHAALRVAPRNPAAREILTAARAAQLGTPGADIADLAGFVQHIVGQRRELGHLVGDVARAAAGLDQPLLVTVMGEFSSGKSSFVNAFIGAEVAPTGITPTTATINVVRYGRERGGRIVSSTGSEAGAATHHVLELGWDALMAHLRALSPETARAIDRVEILVPLPQLEKINIVDTPGLNSIQPEHEATARAFIARADAIVWVFTAAQGGKASEKRALASIRDEGKRVLGVLNKADQLSADETQEVVTFITGELGDLVEAIVPFAARPALRHKQTGDGSDGNWAALETALEQRFFQQARQLKHDACARALRGVVASARTVVLSLQSSATTAADAARAGRDQLLEAAREFADDHVVRERKALSDATAALYRRAAREVLDLVRPRRLPFSSHSATVADRDYLIALLSSGFETAIEAGRRRVAAELTARAKLAETAARTLSNALGVDVIGDLERTAADRVGLALSRVFDRARAFLRGYLAGGYVEAFFRNDVPRLELAEDAVYHALVRAAPDLDRELGEPLSRAATDALTSLAARLDHWASVIDVQAFDIEVGVGRALELADAQLGPAIAGST